MPSAQSCNKMGKQVRSKGRSSVTAKRKTPSWYRQLHHDVIHPDVEHPTVPPCLVDTVSGGLLCGLVVYIESQADDGCT